MTTQTEDDGTFFITLPSPLDIKAFVRWQEENQIECNWCGISFDGGNMYWIKGEGEATLVKLIWG